MHNFWSLVPKFYFWNGNWVLLGSASTHFWVFPIFLNFLRSEVDKTTCMQCFYFTKYQVPLNLRPWPFPYRSSLRRCFLKKGVLGNFTKFTVKHLSQRLFFNKLLKKKLWHRCPTLNIVTFLRTPLLKNTSGRLLLSLSCLYPW